MNRLIIVGNGFDLAHQMRTKYFDFLDDYIRKSFYQARDKLVFEDQFLKIEMNGYFDSLEKLSLKEFLNFNIKKKQKFIVGNDEDGFNFHHVLPCKLSIKSSFIDHLFNSCCNSNWVDIENEYYKTLKPLLEPSKASLNEERLKDLNDSMSYLIRLLNDYLDRQKPVKLSAEYSSIFHQFIIKDEIVSIQLSNDQLPEDLMVLNFNYTSTVNDYCIPQSNFSYKNIHVNNIHGQLNDNKNPIVFGFGDELDADFVKIESDKRKGFLKFIKSYSYFQTSNYHDLYKFIQKNDFQVFILGHSCGLSDRTMLNMIFEHQNCKSIKIFFHETESGDNHRDLTEEISRHFRNKGDMRIKIVPYNKSSAMPQIV